MSYPITKERYHIYLSTSTHPTVCDSLPVALQELASLPSGTIAHVEKVVSTHSVLNIFGTTINPLPKAQTSVIPTSSLSIQYIKKV